MQAVLKEVGIIWRGELARSLRSGRAVVLLLLFLLFTSLVLGVFALLSYGVSTNQEKKFDDEIANSPYKDDLDPKKVAEQKAKQSDETGSGFKKLVINALFADDDTALAEMLLALPFMLLVVFKLNLIFLPLFISLMGFDQISGEMSTRSIRYLVVRVRRSSLVVGKFLAQSSVLALLTFVAVGLMVLVPAIFDKKFGAGAAFGSFAKLWVVSLVFSLAYMALASMCSAMFRQPAVSLAVNMILLFVIWAIALVGNIFQLPGHVASAMSLSSYKSESVVAYLRYLSVWNYSADLIHPQWQRFSSAGAAHLGFAMIFLAGSYLILRARDV
ncbi:MAG: ABC transporter permease subunit [Archangiaceae bacterium]|nr:ABC transporter permease subunit [Archangiaceae bacterium]